MRAILINPGERKIVELPDFGGKLADMELALAQANGIYNAVECVRLGERTDMWIGDEGQLTPGNPIFRLRHAPKMLIAGAAIILDNDGRGECTGTNIRLERVIEEVQWTDLESSGNFTETIEAGNRIITGDPIPQPRGTSAIGSKLISISDAARLGIRRVRLPIWADKMDHFRIDIIGDGMPGPWLHLHAPANRLVGKRDPVDILWSCSPLKVDIHAAEFEIYSGPLPGSPEYDARADSFASIGGADARR